MASVDSCPTIRRNCVATRKICSSTANSPHSWDEPPGKPSANSSPVRDSNKASAAQSNSPEEAGIDTPRTLFQLWPILFRAGDVAKQRRQAQYLSRGAQGCFLVGLSLGFICYRLCHVGSDELVLLGAQVHLLLVEVTLRGLHLVERVPVEDALRGEL